MPEKGLFREWRALTADLEFRYSLSYIIAMTLRQMFESHYLFRVFFEIRSRIM